MELDSPMRRKLERFARAAQRFQESETMPTVLTFNGLRVQVYPNDHPPSHVHVFGGGCEARFFLRCPQGPTVLDENWGFPDRTLKLIHRNLNARLADLCKEWEKLHGTF